MRQALWVILLMGMLALVGCATDTDAGNQGKQNEGKETAANASTADNAAAANNGNDVQQQAPDEEGQTLIVVGQEIPATLDPTQPLSSAYLRNIGAAEALFKVNAAGEVVPELAEHAEQQDANTWTIHLRSGLRFWSGAAVDAEAVIASLERSRAIDLQAQPFLEGMTFTATEADTVTVETVRADMDVPLNLSYYQTVIHNAEQAHDAIATADMTGMYRAAEFVPKVKLELEANTQYWGEAPSFDRVIYEEIADEQTRALTALSGRSHLALNISPSSLAQFKSSDQAEIVASPAANTQTVYLNLQRPQLQDARVRQALAWGVDREELVLLGAEDQSTPVSTWLASNPAYGEAAAAVYPQYDAAHAAALLDEAGWTLGTDGIRIKDGQPLHIRLFTWGGDKALGEALQHQWGLLGVDVEVQHGDYSLIETARETGEWEASIEAWSTFGDEYALLAGQYAAEGRGNYGGYEDADTTALLAQLAEATDSQARRELALAINEHVAGQAPVISLFPRPQLTAVSKQLHGFEQHFRQFENAVQSGLHVSDH